MIFVKKSQILKLFSTNDPTNIVNLKQATLNSLPKDKGLYLPSNIPKLKKEFITSLHQYSFSEISFRVAKELIGKEVPTSDIERICYKSINFPAPVVKLKEGLFIQELFHGPSLAFKDFGARFMAELMSHFIKEENKKLTILVATSGDTGGAVAAGFHNVENIEVIILFPKGKVSPLQELQLTTWGDNIEAIEVDGTFDDCQAMVKRAFLDLDLNKYNLSSANSINISRLIPQSFYYFEAVKQIGLDKEITIAVPSGNIGNISAGSLARIMGLPINTFVASHNANNTVTKYYKTGEFKAKPSVSTISNAMDVGNPSNFPRYKYLNGSTWNNVKANTLSYSYNDLETSQGVQDIFSSYNYISEPHAAVAYNALQEKEINKEHNKIFLGTAHPAKFLEVVNKILETEIEVPEELLKLKNKVSKKKQITNYQDFTEYMLNRI
jgi:threonine synthase